MLEDYAQVTLDAKQQNAAMAVHTTFRRYSRLVYANPSSSYYHKQRIRTALNFGQNEPLQGALADYFFACWYEVAKDGDVLLAMIQDKLPSYLIDAFEKYVRQGYYMPDISPLATRWSVLVTPSMDVPKHQLYISKDDAAQVAKNVSANLLAARHVSDATLVHEIELEYFSHCVACQDRMGFMIAWFALAKEGWEFHEGWLTCKAALEQDNKQASTL